MFLLLVFQYGGLDSVPLALLMVSIRLSLLLAAVVTSFGHPSAAICSNVRMNDESCSRTRPQRRVLRGDIVLYPLRLEYLLKDFNYSGRHVPTPKQIARFTVLPQP